VVLAIFQVNVQSLLVGAGTIVIGLSFAYGTTLQEVFDSLYMLYFVRPFEIGDWLTIDDGPLLKAEKVGLLTTYFISSDGYGIFLRNAKVSHSKLSNFNKGHKTVIEIQFGVAQDTAADQISGLCNELKSYVKKSSDVWSPSFSFFSTGLDSIGSGYVSMSIRARLKSIKWQDLEGWRVAKTGLVLEIQRVCNLMHISIRNLEQPISLLNKLSTDL